MRKKILSTFIASMLLICLHSYTATSIPFANSYTQRSYGVNALYWNPANINTKPMDSEFILFPITFRLENNSFNLHLYNDVVSGRVSSDEPLGYISPALKREILDSIGRRFGFGLSFSMLNIGYSYKHWAFASSTNMSMYARLDKHYIRLLIQGNGYDKNYKFTHRNNNFAAIAYQDYTIGYGGFLLNPLAEKYLPTYHEKYLQDLPDIYTGLSISSLKGIGAAEMDRFHAYFAADSSLDGIKLNQTLSARYGSNGNGFKAAWGLMSEVYRFDDVRNITAGFSIDNIFARIKWTKELEKRTYDSKLEEIDILNLGDFEDLFLEEYTTVKIKSFSTTLPTTYRLGAKYIHSPKMNLSFDIAKKFLGADGFSYDPEISLGFEYNLFDFIPIQLGYRIPWVDSQALHSFGLGFRFKHYETGFGYQSVHGAFTDRTKGMALSHYMKWKF